MSRLPLICGALLLTLIEVFIRMNGHASIGRLSRPGEDQIQDIEIAQGSGGGTVPNQRARIEYVHGRKGPFATVRIYKAAPDAKSEIDQFTTPTQIFVDPSVPELTGYRGRRRWLWGKGLFGLTVTEHEMFTFRSFIVPIGAHSPPSFFLHQAADVNRREAPLPVGSYLLGFDPQLGKWVVKAAPWSLRIRLVPLYLRRIQDWIILMMILFLLHRGASPEMRRKPTASAIILIVECIAFGGVGAYFAPNLTLIVLLALLLLCLRFCKQPESGDLEKPA